MSIEAIKASPPVVVEPRAQQQSKVEPKKEQVVAAPKSEGSDSESPKEKESVEPKTPGSNEGQKINLAV